jgi:hypothetical protein
MEKAFAKAGPAGTCRFPKKPAARCGILFVKNHTAED